VDEIRGVGRWAADKLGVARERERLRVEDRLRQLDELDAALREYIRLHRQKPGHTWDQDAEKLRLRAIGIAPIIGDEELESMVDQIARNETVSDVAYQEFARRSAVLRARTFTPDD